MINVRKSKKAVQWNYIFSFKVGILKERYVLLCHFHQMLSEILKEGFLLLNYQDGQFSLGIVGTVDQLRQAQRIQHNFNCFDHIVNAIQLPKYFAIRHWLISRTILKINLKGCSHTYVHVSINLYIHIDLY